MGKKIKKIGKYSEKNTITANTYHLSKVTVFILTDFHFSKRINEVLEISVRTRGNRLVSAAIAQPKVVPLIPALFLHEVL